MLSGKFLFTLIGIILAIFAICNIDFSGQPIIENWMGMGSQTVTAIPTAVTSNGTTTAFGGNYFDPGSLKGSGKFVSVPSYQSILSPRFSNVQYGANIRYNMPDRDNLATPRTPLTFGNMSKENYTVQENYNSGSAQSSQTCGKAGYGLGHKVSGSYELPVGYTNGNKADMYNKLTHDGNHAPVVSQPCADNTHSSSLPVGTMTTMDALGNPEQFVVMNRLMNTNMKSRKRAHGDHIRGDLAITPCQQAWFSVYPTINVDLNPGAMNVLAGHQAGESNSKLMELLMNASGGSRTTFGGVDFSEAPRVNMTPQYGEALSAASTDVTVTAFP